MKTQIQVKTTDFEYIMQEFDTAMTQEAAVEAYVGLRRAFQQRVNGLPRVEWNRCLDQYRQGEGMSEERMVGLSETQRWMISELDKSDSRLKD